MQPVKDALSRLEQVYALYSRAGRRLRQARRGTGQPRGLPRERRRPQSRAPARGCRRRAAPAALGRRGHDSSPAASAAASRSAGCCCRSPTCCCSTSRPTTSTRSPSPGSRSYLEQYPSTVIAVTHDRYFLDNVAGWILELDRGTAFPGRATTRPGSSRRSSRLAHRGEAAGGPAQDARSASSNGCARTPRRGRPRARRGCALRGAVIASSSRRATRRTRSTSRRARASATS